MNNEERQQNLARLFGTCTTGIELDETFGECHYLYYCFRENLDRMEEIQNEVDKRSRESNL